MNERMGDAAGAGTVPRGALGNGVTDIRSNLEQPPKIPQISWGDKARSGAPWHWLMAGAYGHFMSVANA
jgi:hypothetical protein